MEESAEAEEAGKNLCALNIGCCVDMRFLHIVISDCSKRCNLRLLIFTNVN